MNVLIVEDDLETRELLCEYVDLHSRLNLVGSAANSGDAVDLLKRRSADVVFLDIQLPDASGVELAQKLDAHIAKIFCTGMKQYALEAFEIGAVDYLVKPVTQAKFNRAVERVLGARTRPANTPGAGEPGLFLKATGGNFTFVRFAQLIYLEAKGKSSTAFVYPNSEVHAAMILKSIEERLPRPLFKRIHRQYIVNFSFVSRIEYLAGGKYILHLNDQENSTLPMGRKYIDELRDLIK